MNQFEYPPEHLNSAEKERLQLRQLREVCPEAADLYEEFMDESLPAETFFQKIEEFNETYKDIPWTGPYASVSGHPSDYRTFEIKMFQNGSFSISGGDQNPDRLNMVHETVESTAFAMPKAGDKVTLIKRSLNNNEVSNVPTGTRMSGVLLEEISLGQNIKIDSGGRTSKIQSMRLENGRLVVETETSVYEIEQ